MNFKGITKLDFLYKKLTYPELDILKDYIRKKVENKQKEIGKEFVDWFYESDYEPIECAIERITKVKFIK